MTQNNNNDHHEHIFKVGDLICHKQDNKDIGVITETFIPSSSWENQEYPQIMVYWLYENKLGNPPGLQKTIIRNLMPLPPRTAAKK